MRIHPKAIAALINKEDKCREESLTSKEIQEWFDKKQQEGLYLPKNVCKQGLSDSGWLCKVDGANLLKRLFIEYSGSRVEFSKTKHSFKLTEWLVENEPDHLYELGNFLKEALNKLPKVSDS